VGRGGLVGACPFAGLGERRSASPPREAPAVGRAGGVRGGRGGGGGRGRWASDLFFEVRIEFCRETALRSPEKCAPAGTAARTSRQGSVRRAWVRRGPAAAVAASPPGVRAITLGFNKTSGRGQCFRRTSLWTSCSNRARRRHRRPPQHPTECQGTACGLALLEWPRGREKIRGWWTRSLNRRSLYHFG
jgi:hypothetical protein